MPLAPVLLLDDAGLVDFWNLRSGAKSDAIPIAGLTWRGHDFLDSVRDPEIWRKTKEGATKAGGFTLDLLMDLAKAIIKAKLGAVLLGGSPTNENSRLRAAARDHRCAEAAGRSNANNTFEFHDFTSVVLLLTGAHTKHTPCPGKMPFCRVQTLRVSELVGSGLRSTGCMAPALIFKLLP